MDLYRRPCLRGPSLPLRVPALLDPISTALSKCGRGRAIDLVWMIFITHCILPMTKTSSPNTCKVVNSGEMARVRIRHGKDFFAPLPRPILKSTLCKYYLKHALLGSSQTRMI